MPAPGMQELPLSQELLQYYRRRIDDFEKERGDTESRLDALELSLAERHAQRWQNQQRDEEIHALQQALSDAGVALAEEKQRVILLCAENDSLKAQEMEDRARIQQLLALSQPIAQDVTFHRDGPPSRVQRAGPQRGSSMSVSSQPSTSSVASGSQRGAGPSQPVVRTIFMPDDNADSLEFRVESLQLQLKEQQRLWAEKEQMLMEDRRARMEQLEQWKERSKAEIADLTVRLHKVESSYQETTRDYLLLRHASQQAQQLMKQDNEALSEQNKRLIDELDCAQKQAKADVAATAELVQRNTEAVVIHAKTRAQTVDGELYNMKTEFVAARIAYEKRIKELEASVAKHKTM